MPVDSKELEAFLRTPEAVEMTVKEVAERFDVKPWVVTKIRKRIGEESPDPAEGVVATATAVEDPPAEGDSADPREGDILPAEEGYDLSSAPSDPPPAHPLPEGLSQGVVTVRVGDLDLNLGTKVRDPDETHVQRILDVLERDKGSAEALGRIEVYWLTDLGRLTPTDGFHRVEGLLRHTGEDATVGAVLKEGTLRDAVAASFKHNRAHGRPLTQAERISIINRVLDDPVWGPGGQNWSDRKIAELVGELKTDLVAAARKAWHDSRGTEAPETRTVERNGVQYQQKVPRPKDHAEGDSIDDDGDEDGDDAEQESDEAVVSGRRPQAEIDQEYVGSIKMRKHLHPDLIPAFDKAALAYRDIIPNLKAMRNWCIANKADLGSSHPLFVEVERFAGLPAPRLVDKMEAKKNRAQGKKNPPTWTACKTCQDAEKRTTGRMEDGNLCPKCEGTGIRIPGKR